MLTFGVAWVCSSDYGTCTDSSIHHDPVVDTVWTEYCNNIPFPDPKLVKCRGQSLGEINDLQEGVTLISHSVNLKTQIYYVNLYA